MNRQLIDRLIRELSRYSSSSTVTNPYASEDLRSNLRAYLNALCERPYSGHLLVGEAPGMHGCARTGVPFSSERALRSCEHPFVSELRTKLVLLGNQAERAATIVWSVVEERKSVPAFWNAFPFHPHRPDERRSNRKPTRAETEAGSEYLHMLSEILEPRVFVAVGRVAAQIVSTEFPSAVHRVLVHPTARGRHHGAAQFRSGFAKLGIALR